MKAIIMGCGRVGAALAHRLTTEHHHVCVIDRNPEAQTMLPGAFPGRFLVGNGYNRGVLEQAGITNADAFIAVTSGDNTNIVGARIAKEDFRVPQVIARIYDPRRADIYQELGITTVASVRWTVGRVHQMLLHRDLRPEVTFGNGEALLVEETLPPWLAGRPFHEFDVDGEIRVAAVTRGGRSLLPSHDSVTETGDLVGFVVAATSLGRLRSFLDKELGT